MLRRERKKQQQIANLKRLRQPRGNFNASQIVIQKSPPHSPSPQISDGRGLAKTALKAGGVDTAREHNR